MEKRARIGCCRFIKTDLKTKSSWNCFDHRVQDANAHYCREYMMLYYITRPQLGSLLPIVGTDRLPKARFVHAAPFDWFETPILIYSLKSTDHDLYLFALMSSNDVVWFANSPLPPVRVAKVDHTGNFVLVSAKVLKKLGYKTMLTKSEITRSLHAGV